MKKYAAIINDKYTIYADSMTTLKQQASRKANNDFFDIDTMILKNSSITYHRINKKSPGNNIVRGIWK